MIPYIGPEFVAALHNKNIPRRKEPVIDDAQMKRAAAKTTDSLIARVVAKLRAIRARKTFFSDPPSTHISTPSHCSARHKDNLHVDKLIVVYRHAEEITRLLLSLGGSCFPKSFPT